MSNTGDRMQSGKVYGAGAIEENARRLAGYIRETELEPKPLADEFFYASLPLCAADSVFSIGVRYAATRAAVRRFCARQGWQETVAPEAMRQRGEHRVSDYLAICDGMTPEQMADDLFGNRQRTSPISGILKAEAVQHFCAALVEAGIEDFCDMDDAKLDAAEALVRRIPGQKSGISFDYFRMLAGDDDLIKPDRMVQRYIAGALGVAPQKVSPESARVMVQKAAHSLRAEGFDWSPRRLDHTIWAFQSGTAG
jgi:hypothetical protein